MLAPAKVEAAAGAAAGPPATIPAFLGPRTVAPLAHTATHDIELTAESVKEELPRILQAIVSPAGGTAAQEAVSRTPAGRAHSVGGEEALHV